MVRVVDLFIGYKFVLHDGHFEIIHELIALIWPIKSLSDYVHIYNYF